MEQPSPSTMGGGTRPTGALSVQQIIGARATTTFDVATALHLDAATLASLDLFYVRVHVPEVNVTYELVGYDAASGHFHLRKI